MDRRERDRRRAAARDGRDRSCAGPRPGRRRSGGCRWGRDRRRSLRADPPAGPSHPDADRRSAGRRNGVRSGSHPNGDPLGPAGRDADLPSADRRGAVRRGAVLRGAVRRGGRRADDVGRDGRSGNLLDSRSSTRGSPRLCRPWRSGGGVVAPHGMAERRRSLRPAWNGGTVSEFVAPLGAISGDSARRPQSDRLQSNRRPADLLPAPSEHGPLSGRGRSDGLVQRGDTTTKRVTIDRIRVKFGEISRAEDPCPCPSRADPLGVSTPWEPREPCPRSWAPVKPAVRHSGRARVPALGSEESAPISPYDAAPFRDRATRSGASPLPQGGRDRVGVT